MRKPDAVLNREACQDFHNTSPYTFATLKNDPDGLAQNLRSYIAGFSDNAGRIFESFGFDERISEMDDADILYQVFSAFCDIDLHPDVVPNRDMGYIFEQLIRRFSEQSNETAGDHFTPREVIRLMVNLLFMPDSEVLSKPGVIRTLLDPACGTGGMLSIAQEYLLELNPGASLVVFGQEYNPESLAICGADLMIRGQRLENLKSGNSFTQDGFAGEAFDYLLANPPFGVDWKREKQFIENEHQNLGWAGRFGAGLPRVSDGSLLFLQHMLSKMKNGENGSRIALVMSRTPLYAGDAGSGESKIRQWILENDWLEAIVALPTNLFYNTGIPTFIWILSSRKDSARRGRVQLIDASDMYETLKRSLGEKSRLMTDEHIAEITRAYGTFAESARCRIFDTKDFYYQQVTVVRPLRCSYSFDDAMLRRITDSGLLNRIAKRLRRRGERHLTIREDLLTALQALEGTPVTDDRVEAAHFVKGALGSLADLLTKAEFQSILDQLGTRDDSAEVSRDESGNIMFDTLTSSKEKVPSGVSVEEYRDNVILPFEPDAWLHHCQPTQGAEIPFMRNFPPAYSRPSVTDLCERIERDVLTLDSAGSGVVSDEG